MGKTRCPLDAYFGDGLLLPKQDAAAEQQLSQWKAELDAREKVLVERERHWPKEKKL